MKRKKLLQRELDSIAISILTKEYDIDYFYKKNFEIRIIVIAKLYAKFSKKKFYCIDIRIDSDIWNRIKMFEYLAER